VFKFFVIEYCILTILAFLIKNGLCIGLNNVPANAISWTYYNGVDLHYNKSFSIGFPTNWKLENHFLKDNEGHLILELMLPSNPLDYSSKFTIGIEKSNVETHLMNYSHHVIKLLKNMLVDLKILDSVSVTFSGKQGARIL
jgi:hypothetical protein